MLAEDKAISFVRYTYLYENHQILKLGIWAINKYSEFVEILGKLPSLYNILHMQHTGDRRNWLLSAARC